MAPRASKRVKVTPIATVRSSTNLKLSNHTIYAKDLVQTHAGRDVRMKIIIDLRNNGKKMLNELRYYWAG